MEYPLLGFILSQESIYPQKENVLLLLDAPVPNIIELQKKFLVLVLDLFDLTLTIKRDSAADECQQTIEQIMEVISGKPLLV
jgi:hypothetical protein